MAGHQDEKTYEKCYVPNDSGGDGQNSYQGERLRTVVSDLFRGATISHNPELWQPLPAEKQHDVENSPEFIGIEVQLEALALNGSLDPDAKERRKVLNAQKRKLAKDALCESQKINRTKFYLRDAVTNQ